MANLQTFQLLADICGILKEIQKDPKALDKWAAEAHSLGEQGEAKIKAAHDLIAQIEHLTKTRDEKLAEFTILENKLKGEREIIDGKHLDLQQKIKRMDDKAAKDKYDLAQAIGEHNKRSEDLNAKQNTIALVQKALNDKAVALQAKEDKLIAVETALSIRAASVDERAKEYMDKAEKLRAHTAALLA
jgi:chromosome segregation ATPase